MFVDCLKELPATLLLRPLNVETLSTYIYQFATRGSFEEGSLAALIIVVVGIPAVLLITPPRRCALHPAAAVTTPRVPGRLYGSCAEVDAQPDDRNVVTERGGVGAADRAAQRFTEETVVQEFRPQRPACC